MDCGWHAVWVYKWTRWLGHGEVALWIHRHFHHALYAIFPDYSFHRHLHIEIRTQNDVCVLRNILLIIYFWWAFKTCWYQLVHTVILSSLMRIIVPSQIVVGGGQGTPPFWALINVCHLTGSIERLSPGHNITLCGQIHILNRISRVVDLAGNDQIFFFLRMRVTPRDIYLPFLSSYIFQITLLILIVNIFIIIYNNILYHIFSFFFHAYTYMPTLVRMGMHIYVNVYVYIHMYTLIYIHEKNNEQSRNRQEKKNQTMCGGKAARSLCAMIK